MKVNYNNLARYLLDKKIEIPLFSYFKRETDDDWSYYRELITDNWLNSDGQPDGISVKSVRNKIDRNAKKLNNNSFTQQDLDRVKGKHRSGSKLINGEYAFEDLKVFLNFPDPVEILLVISRKDLKKKIRINSSNRLKEAMGYLNSKRVEQYHPESSDIYHRVPYNETDIRNILIAGRDLFKNLGQYSLSGPFDLYLTDLSELISEWQESIESHDLSTLFNNLPRREHTEWGFVGYEEERKELIEKIAKGNRRLFQVVGQGGSGKSALVNEVCHELLYKCNDELGFNQFIWISSKSDILVNATIKQLSTATKISSYKDLLSQLFLAFNNDNILDFKNFEEFSIEELESIVIDGLCGKDKVKRLIVIDNLENINKEVQKRILNFLDEHVDRPNYIIITSRFRIIEDFPSVNIELGGLGEKHSINLFHKLINYYDYDFEVKSKKDAVEVKKYVSMASYYPLAIKYCIEKAKKDLSTLGTSFEICKSGGTELHSFIFRDTYGTLRVSEKILLKCIVVYKTERQHDIDKQVLNVIFNSINKPEDFGPSLDALYEKTLISYVGLSDDDIEVVLTDLILSHVEDLFRKYEMDISKIRTAIEKFVNQQTEITSSNEEEVIRSSSIQRGLFHKALSDLSNQFKVDNAIAEISKYSSTFYGLYYLKAKSLEFVISNSNKETVRKDIYDHYVKAIRIKPNVVFVWKDYLEFLKKFYPQTIISKLKSDLPLLMTEFFNSVQSASQVSFGEITLEVLSVTKTKNEFTLQFMDFVAQNNISLCFDKTHLSVLKYVLSEWIKRRTKIKYLSVLIKNDSLKTQLIREEYPLYSKVEKLISESSISQEMSS